MLPELLHCSVILPFCTDWLSHDINLDSVLLPHHDVVSSEGGFLLLFLITVRNLKSPSPFHLSDVSSSRRSNRPARPRWSGS